MYYLLLLIISATALVAEGVSCGQWAVSSLTFPILSWIAWERYPGKVFPGKLSLESSRWKDLPGRHSLGEPPWESFPGKLSLESCPGKLSLERNLLERIAFPGSPLLDRLHEWEWPQASWIYY